jgi:hypothetical protein
MQSWQPCVIFFDYDDTLFPTEALFGRQEEMSAPCFEDITPEVRSQLSQVDNAVYRLLHHASFLCGEEGAVRIVTAATLDWVQATMPTLLPLSTEAMHELGIFIAASSDPTGAPSHGPWHKATAFEVGLRKLSKHIRSVVSIGDGLQERVALHFVAEKFRGSSPPPPQHQTQQCAAPAFKSLRLRQLPQIRSLLEQLRFLRDSGLEDLVRGPETVSRNGLSGADLFVDPQQARMCAYTREDEALVWKMVDAMKADRKAARRAVSGPVWGMVDDLLQALRGGDLFFTACRQQTACCAECNQVSGTDSLTDEKVLNSRLISMTEDELIDFSPGGAGPGLPVLSSTPSGLAGARIAQGAPPLPPALEKSCGRPSLLRPVGAHNAPTTATTLWAPASPAGEEGGGRYLQQRKTAL